MQAYAPDSQDDAAQAEGQGDCSEQCNYFMFMAKGSCLDTSMLPWFLVEGRTGGQQEQQDESEGVDDLYDQWTPVRGQQDFLQVMRKVKAALIKWEAGNRSTT